MSPRRKLLRKVLNPPVIKGFKPYGMSEGTAPASVVTLLYEEYEAVRLCDYDMYNHYEASNIMAVSRPTFTRIYALARQKIAQALVEGSQVIIEGGKVYFDSDWYTCSGCHCYFNNPEKEYEIIQCPLCGVGPVSVIDEGSSDMPEELQQGNREAYCICPKCGYREPHQPGRSCRQQVCPACNLGLKRELLSDDFPSRHRRGRKHQT